MSKNFQPIPTGTFVNEDKNFSEIHVFSELKDIKKIPASKPEKESDFAGSGVGSTTINKTKTKTNTKIQSKNPTIRSGK